jgi:hypothetical protein
MTTSADELEGGLHPDHAGDAGKAAQLLFVDAGLAEDADALDLGRRQLAAVAALGLQSADQIRLALCGQVFVKLQNHGFFLLAVHGG